MDLVRLLLLGAIPCVAACQPGALYLPGCLAITDRSTCLFDVTDPARAQLQLGGTIDAAYAGDYTCTALVQGHNLGSPVSLYEAEVEVLDPAQGNTLLKAFSFPVTGDVDPDTGFGTSNVVALDASSLQVEAKRAIASGQHQTVVSRFLLRGRDASGAELLTPWLDYPIDVTVGTSCVAIPGQPCVGAVDPMLDCRLGIDEPVGTSCAAIASQIGVCQVLECGFDPTAGTPDLQSAFCAEGGFANRSCCEE